MRDIKKNPIENIQQTQQKPRPLDLTRIKSGKQTQDVIQKLKPTREQIDTEIARRGYKTSGEIKLGVNRNLAGGMDAGSSSSSSWTSYLSPPEKQDFQSQCQQYKSLKEKYIRYIEEGDNKNSKDMIALHKQYKRHEAAMNKYKATADKRAEEQRRMENSMVENAKDRERRLRRDFDTQGR